jgi:arylsulfatase A
MKKLFMKNTSTYTYFVMISFLLTLLLGSCDSPAKSENSNPPNVIVIMADDLGYETISANGGSSYQTPELDKMASLGIRFDHCYAQPLCTPSRVQIMTGIYNVRNYVRFGLLDTSQTTFGHLFQNAGYETCVIGKWQLGKDRSSPQVAGFDTHCLWQVTEGRTDSTGRDTRFSNPVLEIDGELKTFDENEYGPDIVSDFGVDFIEKSHNEGQPFLLYYPMILTHCPFSPSPDSPEWMSDDSTVMTYKGQAHYFEDMVSRMDKIVGKINRKLEELGISENTLVIFTGDNGTDVPVVSNLNGRKVEGAKGKSKDSGTRVPLIVQWTGKIAPKSVTQDLVDFSDVLPTICQAANIKYNEDHIDGQSFLPQLFGEEGNSREWIYSWYSRSGEKDKARVFARNQRFKLYQTGEFYEVPVDYEEQNPLPIDSLDEKVKDVYQNLKKVIDHYGERRLEVIPGLD